MPGPAQFIFAPETIGDYPAPLVVEALVNHLIDHFATVHWNRQQHSWDMGDDYHPIGDPWPIQIRHFQYPRFDFMDEGYEEWLLTEEGKADIAEVSKPNFAFGGVEIRWYKRIGRDMTANVKLSSEQWVQWFEECTQAIDGENIFANGRMLSRERMPCCSE